MADINFYFRQELAELAFQHTDFSMDLAYNAAFPPMGVVHEAGSFRAGDTRAWNLEVKAVMSKFTTAQTISKGDTPQNYKNNPFALAFEFSKGDLDDPGSFGARTSQEMIQENVQWLSTLLKKKKEKALYTFVSTDANFQSASHFADAATAWNTHATADPVGDVAAGRLLVPEANALIIPWASYLDCQQCTTIKGLASASAPIREGTDPTVTADWLKKVFQVDYIWIPRGSLIVDSSLPSDETKAAIWGNKALLFYHNPNMADKDGRWMKHLFWETGEASSDEGWIVTEKFDQETGLVGMFRWQVGAYYQFLLHRKDLAYRIDALSA